MYTIFLIQVSAAMTQSRVWYSVTQSAYPLIKREGDSIVFICARKLGVIQVYTVFYYHNMITK